MSETTTSFSQELARDFADCGITDAFLVTGGAISPLTTALAEQGRIRMHFMLTEQSAGIAAEAYGYVDLKPALLIVTSGPGVTNAVTPVAAAWTNSSPVIVVSGQARSADVSLSYTSKSRQIGNQHLRTDLLVSSIVKRFIELEVPCATKKLVENLITDATSGRPGPVWLSLPQDVQRGPASLQDLAVNSYSDKPQLMSADFHKLVKEYLSVSKSPAILVGAGARSAFPEILRFAENFQIPILTTWPAMDLIPEENPLFCGRPGSIPSSRLPNFVVTEADFLLILGVRLDLGQVGYNPEIFAQKANVVRVDIDSEEFSRIPKRKNWHNFCAHISDVILPLTRISMNSDSPNLNSWWEKIYECKLSSPKPSDIPQNFADGVSSYQLISKMAEIFAEKTIVTGSSGTCIEMLLQSWEVQQNQRIINSCGLGSMGFALAASYGVAAKMNAKEIVCIESDGSLAMNLQDLSSLNSNGVIFKIIIMDSSGYKSILLSQNRSNQFEHGTREVTNLHLPDLSSIAQAIGFEVRHVNFENEIQPHLSWLNSQETSSVLVVKVSSLEEALPRLLSRPNRMGQMETPPMNELWPTN